MWTGGLVYDNTGTVGHRSQDTALYPASTTDAANSNLYNNNNSTDYLLIRDIDRHAVYEVFCYPAAKEANVCRDLKILESRGWIEKSKANGKWRLSPKFGSYAGTIIKCFQLAKLRLTEDEARYASALQ